MFRNTLSLCFLLALQLSAQVHATENSPLAKFAGEWAIKPNLCGKAPTLDNTFPLNISKDGLQVGVFEQLCNVVKAKKQNDDTFMVRTSCEGECESYFVNQLFEFKGGKLKVIDKEAELTREFHQCNKPKTVNKKPKNGPNPSLTTIIRGRCHMDNCNFYQLGKVVKKQKTKTGQLVVSEYYGGSVSAPPVEGDGDQYANIKVPKMDNQAPSERVTHCSKTRPFVAVRHDKGKYQGLLLNLPQGRAEYTSESSSLYWAICHDLFIGADELWQRRKELNKFGYDWNWPSENDQIEFQSMDDIVVFAKR
jgi:hypothetical protein